VSDVHAEGCKLAWKKPEDDGGQPIENYVVEKMDEATGQFISCKAQPLTAYSGQKLVRCLLNGIFRALLYLLQVAGYRWEKLMDLSHPWR